jgi:hypothetical protein
MRVYVFMVYRIILNLSGHKCFVAVLTLVRHSDSLRAGRSGDRIPVWVRFSAPDQTGPEAHPPSYTLSTRSFPCVKRPGRGVYHPRSSAAVEERGLVACCGVNFTLTVVTLFVGWRAGKSLLLGEGGVKSVRCV